MAAGARRSLQSATIVLTPELGGLSSVDWSQSEAWRVRGYRAAAAHAAALLSYALSPADYAAHLAARRARRRVGPVVPTSIVVKGVSEVEQEAIRRELAGNLDQPLDPRRVDEDILRISGTDRYEHLTYRLVEGAGGSALVVRVKPKLNGPPFLAFGIELNNIDARNFAANLAGRATTYDVLGRGSELRVDFVGGTRLGASAEWFRPLFDSRWFVAPRASAGRGSRNRFDAERLVGEYSSTRIGAGVDVGLLSRHRSEVRLGFDATRVTERIRVGDPLLSGIEGQERVVTAQFTFDGQDSPVIPTSGLYAHGWVRRFFSAPHVVGDGLPAESLDSPQRFWQAEADAFWFRRVGGRDRLFLRGAAGTSFDAVPSYNGFSLGGPFRMGAFSNDELRGAHFTLASAGFIKDIERLRSPMGGHAFLATWIEAGSAFRSRVEAVWHTDLSAGLILDSVIGPMFVGGSLGPGGHCRLYVSLGPLFR
jgi:NTE family protein